MAQMREKRAYRDRQPKALEILHEDKDIIVIDKAPGLLSIGNDKEGINTAFYILTDYVRKGNPKSPNRVYIVHRLDRDTSGVLIFAKSEEAKVFLQDHWLETEKIYLAVVHGKLAKKSDTIISNLMENKAHMVYSSKDPKKGSIAKTKYRVVKEKDEFSLVEINLLTGRKNQIRVHFSEMGHPVVGDKKYGNGPRVHKRLALHARSITFTHPFTGKRMNFEAAIPRYFNSLVGEI